MARPVQPARRAKTKLKQKRAAELRLVFVRNCRHCRGDHERGPLPDAGRTNNGG